MNEAIDSITSNFWKIYKVPGTSLAISFVSKNEEG